MIAWIALKTGLSALVVKLILCAGALTAIFLCLRWYGNRQWYAGEQHGRQVVAKEIVKAKEAEWKAKEDAIARAGAAIEADRDAINDARNALARDRAGLSRSLNDGLARIQAERSRQYADAATVPDPLLDAAIRAISTELANAQP